MDSSPEATVSDRNGFLGENDDTYATPTCGAVNRHRHWTREEEKALEGKNLQHQHCSVIVIVVVTVVRYFPLWNPFSEIPLQVTQNAVTITY